MEVDGGQHLARAAADARRDRKLERLGYRVLRIPAQLVMRALSVKRSSPEELAQIRAMLEELAQKEAKK